MGLFFLGACVLVLVLLCRSFPKVRTALITLVGVGAVSLWYAWRRLTAKRRAANVAHATPQRGPHTPGMVHTPANGRTPVRSGARGGAMAPTTGGSIATNPSYSSQPSPALSGGSGRHGFGFVPSTPASMIVAEDRATPATTGRGVPAKRAPGSAGTARSEPLRMACDSGAGLLVSGGARRRARRGDRDTKPGGRARRGTPASAGTGLDGRPRRGAPGDRELRRRRPVETEEGAPSPLPLGDEAGAAPYVEHVVVPDDGQPVPSSSMPENKGRDYDTEAKATGRPPHGTGTAHGHHRHEPRADDDHYDRPGSPAGEHEGADEWNGASESSKGRSRDGLDDAVGAYDDGLDPHGGRGYTNGYQDVYYDDRTGAGAGGGYGDGAGYGDSSGYEDDGFYYSSGDDAGGWEGGVFAAEPGRGPGMVDDGTAGVPDELVFDDDDGVEARMRHR